MIPTEITTQDGTCRAWVARPTGDGPWPAVLFYMDGVGPRPALFEMAERLAQHGYFVLLPDMFYRVGEYETLDAKQLFSDQELRKTWMTKFMSVATQPNAMRDTEAFLAYLAAQPDVVQPRVGTIGYCMGGAMALSAAGFFPERVAAAASFHGAYLATDAPTSPHLLAAKMKARIYVAGAIEDASFSDDMKAKLDAALTEANVPHTIETYPARHGWVPRDIPVHDPAQAERHWHAVFELFDSTLRG